MPDAMPSPKNAIFPVTKNPAPKRTEKAAHVTDAAILATVQLKRALLPQPQWKSLSS
jgi:hypothetical protein